MGFAANGVLPSSSKMQFHIDMVQGRSLRIYLFDHQFHRSKHPIGRIIIPLRDLHLNADDADGATGDADGANGGANNNAHRRGGEHAEMHWFEFFPPSVEGSKVCTQKWFVEGMVGYPGSAMLRPERPIGFVRVRTTLELVSDVRSGGLYAATLDAVGSTHPALFSCGGM